MSTRRQPLEGLRKTRTTNAGLWLDKFICEQAREDKESRRILVQEAAEIGAPQDYACWFEGWRQALEDYGAECREATAQGRMAIGLGEESVLETAVALHHTYGVPYIPGSALKGLAASFARQQLGDDWQADTPAYVTVFGDTKTAGYVTFFDALPLPSSAILLHADVITVHHEKYYQNDRTAPPADWDDPTPVPFLSATGKYLVALGGPSAWVSTAFEILKHALAHAGIGAKTSSGYGRLTLSPPPVDVDQVKADQVIASVEALKLADVAGRIHAYFELWHTLDVSPAQRRRVAEAIVAKVKEAGREKQSRDKDWYQQLLVSIQ